MSMNPDIQKIFEIADDSLQGVLGYHFYVIAMQENVDREKVLAHLPNGVIPHTFSWDRFYDKIDLTSTIASIFEPYQSRISLLAMVNVFEAALTKFIEQLNIPKSKYRYYKSQLRWAYGECGKCDVGDTEAIERLPETFGKIDNARRLRNLIVHNHGLLSEPYEQNAINEFKVEMHPDHATFMNDPATPVPVNITKDNIIDFSRAHIEVLHVLHNSIQKNHFGFAEPYEYCKQQKRIEWHKVLVGV